MENDFFPWTQNPATFPTEVAGHHWSCSPDMNLYKVSSNPEYSLIQTNQFESRLSSMVSSPAASAIYGGGGVNIQSANNSCYSTPMNSPPKLNLTPFAADPGYAERAAMFSCFGGNTTGQLLVNDVNSDKKILEKKSDSFEESSVSEKLASREGIGRKRKSIPRGKAKVSSKVDVSSNDSDSKRAKSDVSEIDGNVAKQEKENSKLLEAPKDYIHVRARRGQATDSHSLAERVRREKISERMKFLQDLVPGCNKVTGKAVMLDEIINYVQSLQRQVEGLSMKLATASPRMDNLYMEALLSKEIFQSRGIMNSAESSSSASAVFPYAYQSQFCNDLLNYDQLQQSHHNSLQLLSSDGFCNSASQVSIWEDELHNVVHAARAMGLSHMKMEP